jgi:hypothetical protein
MTIYGRFNRPVDEPAGRTRRRGRWQWLLCVPLVLALLSPLYNRIDPRLFGVPFFYWYQLALVGVDIVVISVVYQTSKER